MTLDAAIEANELVEKFGRFLSGWFIDPRPNEHPLVLEGEADEIFQVLPPDVRDFYRVVHRWTQAGIGGDVTQDVFVTPPRYQRNWEGSPDGTIDREYATLVSENQGNWEVVISLRGSSKGCLFTDRKADGTYPEQWVPMQTPAAEFLVTFAFRELIICNEQFNDNSTDLFSESTKVFSGHYQADKPLNIFYHPAGHLWIANEENEPLWSCARAATAP